MYGKRSVSAVVVPTTECDLGSLRTLVAEHRRVPFVDELLLVLSPQQVEHQTALADEGARVVIGADAGEGTRARAGLDTALGDWLVVCEAHHPVSEMAKLLLYLEAQGDDAAQTMVIGSRTVTTLHRGISLPNRRRWVWSGRRLGLRLGVSLSDTGCLLFALPRPVHSRLQGPLSRQDRRFSADVMVAARQQDVDVIEIPTIYRAWPKA